MARKFLIIIIPLFLLVITDVNAQFFDFLQGWSSPIIQQYQPARQDTWQFLNDYTTKKVKNENRHEQTTKRNTPVSSHIESLERDENTRHTKEKRKRKQTTIAPVFNFNFFTTTVKPIRKVTKTDSSHRSNSGSIASNSRDNSRISNPRENSRDSSSKENSRTSTNNGRLHQPEYEIDNSQNRQSNNGFIEKPIISNIADDYYTTRRHYEITTKPYDYSSHQNNKIPYNYDSNNQQNNRVINNYENNNNQQNNRVSVNYDAYTTKNPFYNRPGVRPAVIENRPAITNRPVTKPAYIINSRPTDAGAIAFPADDSSPEIIAGPDEDLMSEAEKRRYIEMAERMCDKYKSLNTKQVQAIPLLPSPEPVQVNVSVCAPTTIPLVVGGKVVSIKEFPHMALLGWLKLEGGGYSWKCGGSLISDRYVLTAAHCAYQERDNTVVTGAPRAVQLGSSFLDDPGALVVKVAAVVRHPKYKFPKSYYDVALLKLVSSVTFSEVIKPACLGVPPPVGEHIIATGWGRTEFGGDQSNELRSVSLPVWDLYECGEVLGTSRKLPDGVSSISQMCAGERLGGKDTCQGDSGGPAQMQDGCVWRVVAVTSLGRSCGAPNTPGLYAKCQRAFIAAQVFGQHRNGIASTQPSNNNRHNINNNNNNEGINNNQGYNNNGGINNNQGHNNNQGNNNNYKSHNNYQPNNNQRADRSQANNNKNYRTDERQQSNYPNTNEDNNSQISRDNYNNYQPQTSHNVNSQTSHYEPSYNSYGNNYNNRQQNYNTPRYDSDAVWWT